MLNQKWNLRQITTQRLHCFDKSTVGGLTRGWVLHWHPHVRHSYVSFSTNTFLAWQYLQMVVVFMTLTLKSANHGRCFVDLWMYSSIALCNSIEDIRGSTFSVGVNLVDLDDRVSLCREGVVRCLEGSFRVDILVAYEPSKMMWLHFNGEGRMNVTFDAEGLITVGRKLCVIEFTKEYQLSSKMIGR